MKTYATRYPNGKIRCTNCEQLLSDAQKICPNCKSEIIGYIKETSNFRTDQAQKIATKTGKKKAKAIDRNRTKWVILAIFVIAALVLFKYYLLPKTGLFPAYNYAKHMEAPTEQKIIDKGGYSYKITQFFIEIDRSDEAEKAIVQMLTESDIDFENLYYTKEGFYTADLVGYGPYTYNTYKEKADELLDTLTAWGKENPNILSGKQIHLQSWYMK